MTDCIFCKIARNEASAEKLLETGQTVAFLDIRPRSIGHTLVIPRAHTVRLAELEDVQVAELFRATRDVTRMLQDALQPDALTIGINDGRAAGQEVPHLHVNIIPRFNGDGGLAIHSVVHNAPSESISETAQRIRSTP